MSEETNDVAETPLNIEQQIAEIGASFEGKVVTDEEGNYGLSDTSDNSPAAPAPADNVAPEEKKPDDAAGEKPQSENPELDAELDKMKLPAHAQKSTREQFDTVKQLVRTKDKAHRTELANLRAELEAVKKTAGGLDENTKKELEELRSHRAIHAYRETPEFREKYEKPVEAARDTILRRFQRAGMPPEDLAAAKELLTKRGVRGIDWNTQLESIPDEYTKNQLRREIEAMEDAEESRKDGIKDAEANKEKLLSSIRQSETGKSAAIVSEADKFAVDLLKKQNALGIYDVSKLPKEEQALATKLNDAQRKAQSVYEELIKDPYNKENLGKMLYLVPVAIRQEAIIQHYGEALKAANQKIADFEKKAGVIRQAKAAPSASPGGTAPRAGRQGGLPSEEVSLEAALPGYLNNL